MSNQYDVLGKAPGAEDLKKLAPDNNHLTIKNLSAGYGKMEIVHDFNFSAGDNLVISFPSISICPEKIFVNP